jgi:hypothetical protein
MYCYCYVYLLLYLCIFIVMYDLICVLFVCQCVLYECHWVPTQLHLTKCRIIYIIHDYFENKLLQAFIACLKVLQETCLKLLEKYNMHSIVKAVNQKSRVPRTY